MIFKIKFTTRDSKKAKAALAAQNVLRDKYKRKYKAQYKALVLLGESRVCDHSVGEWVSHHIDAHRYKIEKLKYEPLPLVEKLGIPGTDILDDIIERYPELECEDVANIDVDVSCPKSTIFLIP